MNIRAVMIRPAWRRVETFGAISKGLREGIRAFHEESQPLKFEERGNRIYQLGKRNKGYQIDKKRIMGHNRPNVWTGKGREKILKQVLVTIFSNRPTAVGKWRAPFLNLSNALGTHPKKIGGKTVRVRNFKRQPDHRKEIEKTSKKDNQLVAGEAEKFVAKFFNTPGPKTIKII